MSRIRSIHPGFFTDEELVSTSCYARLLFLGIGVEADDKGVFEWKPLTLKMRLFPVDNVDVAELLEELRLAGAVMKYEAAGKFYGAIKNFRKYQKPKTPNDIHPISDEGRKFVGLTAVEREAFPQKGEKSFQMEEGGEDGEEDGEDSNESLPPVVPPAKKRAVRCPSDWRPDALPEPLESEVLAMPAGWIERELTRMKDWSLESKNGAKLDWNATWRNWLRRQIDGQGGQGNRSSGAVGNSREDPLAAGVRRALAKAGGGGQHSFQPNLA